ncbi:MAG: recombinase family protein [Solirubrobacteraceae bacterium]
MRLGSPTRTQRQSTGAERNYLGAGRDVVASGALARFRTTSSSTGGWLRRRRRLAPDPTTCWRVARSSLSRWVRRPGPCPNPDERAPSAILFLPTGVSTGEQELALQLDALNNADAARIYQDVGSRSLRSRPQLDECLDRLRSGDTLVGCLGRSLRNLIEVVLDLDGRAMAVRSLKAPCSGRCHQGAKWTRSSGWGDARPFDPLGKPWSGRRQIAPPVRRGSSRAGAVKARRVRSLAPRCADIPEHYSSAWTSRS